jgi:hypothetical protein
MGSVNNLHDVKVPLIFPVSRICQFRIPLTVDAAAIDFCQLALLLYGIISRSSGETSAMRSVGAKDFVRFF